MSGKTAVWPGIGILALLIGASVALVYASLGGEDGAPNRSAVAEPTRYQLPTAPYSLARATAGPVFAGVVNGIVVGPFVRDPWPAVCVDNEPIALSIELVEGAPLDMKPSWLPQDVTFVRGHGTTCGDTLIYVEREYVVATNIESGRPGGSFAIRRSLRDPANGVDLVGSRDRIYSFDIAGRPAVGLSLPPQSEQDARLTNQSIAIREIDGFTVIQGTGLTWTELRAIAASLYAER